MSTNNFVKCLNNLYCKYLIGDEYISVLRDQIILLTSPQGPSHIRSESATEYRLHTVSMHPENGWGKARHLGCVKVTYCFISHFFTQPKA